MCTLLTKNIGGKISSIMLADYFSDDDLDFGRLANKFSPSPRHSLINVLNACSTKYVSCGFDFVRAKHAVLIARVLYRKLRLKYRQNMSLVDMDCIHDSVVLRRHSKTGQSLIRNF